MRTLVFVVALLAGCGTQVHVEPVKIQPIHITVDVNVHDAAKGVGAGADKDVGDSSR